MGRRIGKVITNYANTVVLIRDELDLPAFGRGWRMEETSAGEDFFYDYITLITMNYND